MRKGVSTLRARTIYHRLRSATTSGGYPLWRFIRYGGSASRKTQARLRMHEGSRRRLEIGPGDSPVPGFETLDVIDAPHVDYICDATGPLPFSDGTFEIVYASHILEHVPWYQSETVLKEWVRILRPDGLLEVWVPDALKICKAFVDAELHDNDYIDADGWYRWNEERDPCKWAAGRLYTYGDGVGGINSPNWHRALFSTRYLKKLMLGAGLVDVELLTPSSVRGHDHGWINLGMRGRKP